MDIFILCNGIDLQPEIKERVMDFVQCFNFETVARQLNDLLIYKNVKIAHSKLQEVLGEDKDHIKILACMLKASADAWKIYEQKGIGAEIYYDTMKCYTRFIDETYRMTGRLYFDRYWWTARQAGCHLFRIGALEYEAADMDGKRTIRLHIPSDADFSPSAVEQSLESAGVFFHQYYPEMADAEYCCHSWLLDPGLREMLREGSNIIRFQDRFEIYDEGEANTEFIEWVFKKRPDIDYVDLPEDTSLQRNVKKHLLSGGVIRNAYGKIKKEGKKESG